MNLTDYLPPILQMKVVYWTIAVCWAVGYFCRTLPPQARTQLVIQWAILCAGLATDVLLMPSSVVYALGCGLISAVLSMVSYDLILDGLVQRIGAVYALIFGNPPKQPVNTIDSLPPKP